MPKAKNEGPTPILSFTVIFIFSLGAAWLFYGILESTGAVKNEAVELGGAAAGFLAFFLAGHKVFGSLTEAWERRTGLAERNASLEKRVLQLTGAEIPRIERPEGFVRFASRDYGLGFSRPQNWSPHEEMILGIFKRPADDEVRRLGFQGNITVTVSPYSLATQIDHPLLQGTEEEKRLKAPHVRTIQAFSVESEAVGWDETYVQNRRALRASFDYAHFQSRKTIYTEAITLLGPVNAKSVEIAQSQSSCLEFAHGDHSRTV